MIDLIEITSPNVTISIKVNDSILICASLKKCFILVA